MANNEASSVQLVTIQADEYAHLLDCKRRLDDAATRLGAFAKPPRSPFERDVEVATFIAGRLGKMHADNLLTECLERFGWKRTPSKSAVYGYWRRLREGASKSL